MYINIVNSIITKRKGMRKRKEMPNPICDWPVNVISKDMGCDRGTPIDRYYIENFLNNQKKYITGNVMEIGDNSYTLKYGRNIANSYILTADKKQENCKKSVVIYGDLQTGLGCENDFLDCFILTQTLPFIYDVKSAAANIVNMLNKGGVALITVSGISMLSMYDDSRWGHYWGFTETSLKKLFENIVGDEQIEIFSMGNPKTAAAFLYGLSVEDLERKDFEINDSLIPVTIGAVIHK